MISFSHPWFFLWTAVLVYTLYTTKVIYTMHFLLQLSLGVEDGILQSYNQDFELQFAHKISQMMRFSQADLDPCTFLYLLRDDFENLLYCYLFQAKKTQDVSIFSCRYYPLILY